MPTLTVSQPVSASPDRVWEALADFSRIDRFHPHVQHVDQLSVADRGLDARRRCNFYDGASVVEQVVEWRRGAGYTVELEDIHGMPMRSGVASLSVAADGAGSIVTMQMDYRVKYGPLGWVMGVTMMRLMMRRLFARVIRGLEYHAVTGEVVGREVPALPAAA